MMVANAQARLGIPGDADPVLFKMIQVVTTSFFPSNLALLYSSNFIYLPLCYITEC